MIKMINASLLQITSTSRTAAQKLSFYWLRLFFVIGITVKNYVNFS